MQKHLILLRGLPGSGKSTVAEKILGQVCYSNAGELRSKTATICTADDYFMENGEYKFNPKALPIAHKVCYDKCEKAMAAGEERVIVANTSTTEKELKPYMELAEKYGYMTISMIIENRHGSKNVHGVPKETIEKMRNRFEIKL